MAVGPVLDGFFLARAGRFRALQPRPKGRPRLSVVGSSPLRVLVTGAGLAAGYGVTRQEDGLGGILTTALAEATGRGVVTEVSAAPVLPASRAVAHIGLVGAHTFDVAVFAPCFLEASFRPGAGVPRHGAEIVRHLRDTGGPMLQVLLLGIPAPAGGSAFDRAAGKAASVTNGVLQQLADRHPGVVYVDAPAFHSVHDRRPFDPGYYADAGARVARTASPAYTRSVRTSTTDRSSEVASPR